MADFPDVARAMDTARRAVEAAAEASLRHWRRLASVETKPDGTAVTVADRESEAAILGVVRGVFPGHAILTEESGALGEPGSSCWIVDPLDGTLGFSRGGPCWGPLVALEHEGQVVAGAMALPALGETYWAGRGLGCWRDGERLSVSSVAEWSQATLVLGEIGRLLEKPREAGILSLLRTARQTRCPGDLAGAAVILSGRGEAWLEAGVQPWDVAAIKVLVEEAGGRFTDFSGRESIESGEAVVTNGRLHPHVLRHL